MHFKSGRRRNGVGFASRKRGMNTVHKQRMENVEKRLFGVSSEKNKPVSTPKPLSVSLSLCLSVSLSLCLDLSLSLSFSLHIAQLLFLKQAFLNDLRTIRTHGLRSQPGVGKKTFLIRALLLSFCLHSSVYIHSP